MNNLNLVKCGNLLVRLFQDAAWEKGQNLPLLSRKAKLAGQMFGCKNVCASFANVL